MSTLFYVYRTTDRAEPDFFGAGGAQREWGQWSLNEVVNVAPFDIFASGHGKVYLGSITADIDFYSRNRAIPDPFKQEDLAHRFFTLYQNQILSPGQKITMEFKNINFKITITGTQVVDLGTQSEKAAPTQPNARGILVQQTEINFFKPNGGLINLKADGSKPRANAILAPNFKFEDMGIGGLDDQFSTIFRRSFASRIYPPKEIERLGITHVKGMLLYGPPGTGKTLIARQIGKMLNAVEPKIVNGPEMLNKYVGGSEENIRKLFKDAEAEYKEKGDESNLHMIIFDELDAVFKQRGSRGDGTGVGDNVVNQLLAKMDGVDALNNILVIGMTNRKDLIDSALLRPGRFEVQLEIPLPDEAGRRQIFKIHTTSMVKEKKLNKDVNLDELAARTKNFSGAEIAGLVKSAASFAINRHITQDASGIHIDKKEVVVSMDDFNRALQEVKAAFGVSEQELEDCVSGGIINYSPHVQEIMDRGTSLINHVKQSDILSIISVLLHGPPGSGKTALAATIALSSHFPFIRMISPKAMIGMTEANRIQYISNVFLDSYKSPLSVVVIDKIDAIMEWVPIGPRFSNALLQAFMVFLQDKPPNNHKLMVLATTSRHSVLEQMDLLPNFNQEIFVPNVSSVQELISIMEKASFLTPETRQQAVQQIHTETKTTVLGMGIKKVLFNIEDAKISNRPDLDEFVNLTVRDIENMPGRSKFDF